MQVIIINCSDEVLIHGPGSSFQTATLTSVNYVIDDVEIPHRIRVVLDGLYACAERSLIDPLPAGGQTSIGWSTDSVE